MKPGISLSRILAVFFSLLLFGIGVVVTLGIFLPMAGYVESASINMMPFKLGQKLFSVYGFSSFLIPILFLYAAVLLLIPGWSRESKTVLLGAPLYFITSLAGERLIHTCMPAIHIPVVQQFVVISIIICILLFICFEIFLMIELGARMPFYLGKLPQRDLVADTYESDEPEFDEDTRQEGEAVEEERLESAVQEGVHEEDAEAAERTPETADVPVMGEDAEQPRTDEVDYTAESAAVHETADTAEPAEQARGGELQCAEEPEAVLTSSEVPPVPIYAEASVSDDTGSADSSEKLVQDGELPAQYLPAESAVSSELETSGDSSDAAEPVFHGADGNTEELEAVDDTDKAVESAVPPEPEQPEEMAAEPPEEAETGADDADIAVETEPVAEEGVTAVDSGNEAADNGETKLEADSEVFTLPRTEEPVSVRDSFDPSDPNNLFTSLDDIIADVERIKRTDFSAEPIEAAGKDGSEEETPVSVIERQKDAEPTDFDHIDSGAEASAQEPDEQEDVPQHEITDGAAAGTSFAAASDSAAISALIAENAEAAKVSIPSVEAEEQDVQQSVAGEAAKQEEPELSGIQPDEPLVFANGVPVPDEMSDLLDSLVVIDPDAIPAELAASEAYAPAVETTSEEAYAPAAETAAAEADYGQDAYYEGEQPEPEDAADTYESEETDDRLFEQVAVPAVAPVQPLLQPPRKKYAVPFDLLTDYPDGEYWVIDDATRKAGMLLKSTFNEFKIDVSITGIKKGPVVTMFEMLPSPGIKLSKITNLQDNIALRLAASSVRIVAPIPGKHAVGIEVPNKKRSIVSFRELIETDLPESEKMAIPVVLGKDVTGNPQLVDLAQTPHLLIAGATGSGKSVCVNTIILSILYNRRPDEVKLILVDPKIVELKLYNDIAHLLTPVITEPKRAFQALQYALCEMERRYALLDNMGVRDIKTFNTKIKAERIATEPLPYIVIIIDEFADLMATSGKELEATVARLCAMSRAVGIHLVLATQRPSIDVITGLIKANIPSRIAFMVASKTDSRIILDEMGAEKLLGKGDMLFVSAARPFPTRMQGAFVSEQEVERVVACVKEYCEPEYIDEEIFVDDDEDSFDNAVFSDDNDPLYEQALEIVTFAGKASASYVQRKLKIGYNRAARLIEEMEARGIVGPANGSKPREIVRHP